MATRKKQQNNISEITPVMLNKLKDLRKGCGLRKFESDEDRSYLQWKNEAENLIIRIFGEGSNQYSQFNSVIRNYENRQPEKRTLPRDYAYHRVLKLGHTEREIEDMSEGEWDKLVKKSGILKELAQEESEIEKEHTEKLFVHTNIFKEQMRDVFTAWIKELEIFVPVSDEKSPKRYSSGARIKNVQTQNVDVSVTINIDQRIETIIENIRADEPDETRVKEAEENLTIFKDEIKKEKPQWSTIKNVLEWALNFGRDIFIQILPILLEKYGR